MNSCTVIIVVYFSMNSQQWVNRGMKIWNFLWGGIHFRGERLFLVRIHGGYERNMRMMGIMAPQEPSARCHSV